MQKAALFKVLAVSCLACFVHGTASAQASLAEIIEKTKQNKRDQLQAPTTPPKGAGIADLPPSLVLDKPVASRPRSSAAKPLQIPALWSLNGVNNRWVAELWYLDAIHRFTVVPGLPLPGGWKVVSGDDKSLTLAKGKHIQTLYPPALGSTGGEFAQIQKTMGFEASMISFAREVQAVTAPLPSFQSQPAPAVAPVSPSSSSSSSSSPSPAVQAAAQLPPSNK